MRGAWTSTSRPLTVSQDQERHFHPCKTVVAPHRCTFLCAKSGFSIVMCRPPNVSAVMSNGAETGAIAVLLSVML